MKTLQEIAASNNLEIVETTSQANGYPSNLQNAIIGLEDFAQAEELSQKYGLKITSLKKKDGWNLWARRGGISYEPFKNSADDFGDNYAEFPKMDEDEFLESEVKFLFEDDLESFDKIEAILKCKKEIWEEIEKMEDDELVITFEGYYSETIKKESMYFYHNTNHYAIALMQDI